MTENMSPYWKTRKAWERGWSCIEHTQLPELHDQRNGPNVDPVMKKSVREQRGAKFNLSFINLFICTVAALPHVKCTRTYHKLGCYKKVSSSSNPWQLLITDRSDSPDGYLLDWRKWEESIHRYVCEFCIKTSYTKYRNCGTLVFVNIGYQLVSKRLLNCFADESKI